MPWEQNGRRELLIAGGDALTGHDPETGRELWRWETWNPTKIGQYRCIGRDRTSMLTGVRVEAHCNSSFKS